MKGYSEQSLWPFLLPPLSSNARTKSCKFLKMISVVYVHQDGYKFEERYGDKAAFRRAVKRFERKETATFLHGTDFIAGVAIRPANIWGYLRS